MRRHWPWNASRRAEHSMLPLEGFVQLLSCCFMYCCVWLLIVT